MSGAEELPDGEKEKTSDGQQVGDSENEITPAYLNHIKEVLAFVPTLKDVKAYLPIGTTLPLEQWIFPVLDKCKEVIGKGIVIRPGEEQDIGWLRCFGAGMPKDMQPIDLYILADAYHEKYKDFAIHGKGVISDPDNPEKGESVWRWVMNHPMIGKEYSFHLWSQMVYLRNSTTQMVAHYNSGIDPLYSSITQMQRGVRYELVDIDLSDKASAHLLLDYDVLFTDSQRILDAAAEKRGGPHRSKGFDWTDDACLRLRTEYYGVTLPAMNNAETICKAMIETQTDSREGILAACRRYADVDLIIALHNRLTTKRGLTASDLALEQAARNIGVDKNMFELSSLRTYLAKGNKLAKTSV